MSIAIAVEDRPSRPRGRDWERARETADAQVHDIARASGRSPLVSRLILVAEDDSSLRESVKEILSGEGHVVLEAEDGQVAFDILNSSPVDVLILDLAMPHLNGLDLLRQIDPPPPVVVVYSAFEYFTPEELRQAAGAKVFRSLKKPVPPAQLIATVTEAIDRREAHDE